MLFAYAVLGVGVEKENCGAASWLETVEQSVNLIFKLDTAEQCLTYMKALIHVSFIQARTASQQASQLFNTQQNQPSIENKQNAKSLRVDKWG